LTFKNINTAINQELGLISAQQHSYINRKYGKQVYNNSKTGNGERSIYSKPDEFETWFNKGLRYYETVKGFKFQWLDLVTLKVTMPNGRTGKRTIADFEDEYKNEYRRQFPNCH